MAVLQVEMNHIGKNTALQITTRSSVLSMELAGKSSGAARAGAFRLGQQIQDVAVQGH